MVALVLTSCAVFEGGDQEAPLTENIGKFSDLNQGGRLPKAWQIWRITPQKNNTEYTLKKMDGKIVLHADANMAASGLVLPLKPRAAKDLFLTWEWKALSYIPGADNADAQKDDAPLRILVARCMACPLNWFMPTTRTRQTWPAPRPANGLTPRKWT